MEVDGSNMDENILSSETTTMTEVIHELLSNEEETRDVRVEDDEKKGVETTPPIPLLTTAIPPESANNTTPEGRLTKREGDELT